MPALVVAAEQKDGPRGILASAPAFQLGHFHCSPNPIPERYTSDILDPKLQAVVNDPICDLCCRNKAAMSGDSKGL